MRRTQVDGAYEDWVELLRLVYYSGMCLCKPLPYVITIKWHRQIT